MGLYKEFKGIIVLWKYYTCAYAGERAVAYDDNVDDMK